MFVNKRNMKNLAKKSESSPTKQICIVDAAYDLNINIKNLNLANIFLWFNVFYVSIKSPPNTPLPVLL